MQIGSNAVAYAVEILESDILWRVLFTAALYLGIWFLLRKLLDRIVLWMGKWGRSPKNPEKLTERMKYILLCVFALEMLDIFGLDLSSLFAGLGIAGIVAAFAVQDLLKDVVMGSNILTGNYFSVGDVIRYGDVKAGKVIAFTARTTRIEDLGTGNIISVANRNITEVTVLSNWQDLDIPAPYEIPAKRMRELCEKLCERIAALENVEKCEFMGTQDLGDSAVFYRLRITGAKDKRSAIRRAALGCMQDLYAEENISVPYPVVNVIQNT